MTRQVHPLKTYILEVPRFQTTITSLHNKSFQQIKLRQNEHQESVFNSLETIK